MTVLTRAGWRFYKSSNVFRMSFRDRPRKFSTVTPSIPFFITYTDAEESFNQWASSQTSNIPEVSTTAHWVPFWHFEIMAFTSATGPSASGHIISECSSCAYVPQMPELQMLASTNFTAEEISHVRCPFGDTKFQRMEHEDEDVLETSIDEETATRLVREHVMARENDRMLVHIRQRGGMAKTKVEIETRLEVSSRLVYMPVYEVTDGKRVRAIVNGFDGCIKGRRLRDTKRAVVTGAAIGTLLGYPSILLFSTLPLSYSFLFGFLGAGFATLHNSRPGYHLITAENLTTSHASHTQAMEEDMKAQEMINSANYAFMNFAHRGRTTRRRSKPMYGKFMEDDFSEAEDEQEAYERNENKKHQERRHAQADGTGWRTRTFGQEEPKREHTFNPKRKPAPKVFKELYDLLDVEINATDEQIRDSFNKMTKSKHPDLFADAAEDERKEAVQEFQQILEAFTILRDKKKRERYDKTGEYKKS